MNNSSIALDTHKLSLSEENVPKQELLRTREAELMRFIAALERVAQSEDWSTLKKLKFDSHVESLEKQLKAESERLEINQPLLNHLQGELKWARKYVDLDKMAYEYRIELSKIRSQLKQYE